MCCSSSEVWFKIVQSLCPLSIYLYVIPKSCITCFVMNSYVWVCSICWKQSLVKKNFFNWILQVFQTHWIWYIYCVYPYLYRSQLLGLMLYQSSLWLELINKQLGIFNLFSFFLVYFFSLSLLVACWLPVDRYLC